MAFVLIIFSIITFIFFYSKYKVLSFNKYGIKYSGPVPLFGNLHRSVFALDHLSSVIKKIYDSLPNERYFALFEFFNPSIVLKDCDVIKRITIKDFEHFHDVPFQIDENVDPVFGRNLLALKGEKWHQTRAALSPAFTSFKMKNMFVFMNECAKRVKEFYINEMSASNDSNEIDAHDIASRFTIDVVASTAFSYEVNSCKDRDNKFFKEACTLSTPSLGLLLKFTGYRVFPGLMKRLGIQLIKNDSIKYFRNLMLQTIKDREESGIIRKDMMHLLLEAKKGSLKFEEETEEAHEFATVEESSYGKKSIKTIKWTDDDIVAQALVLILGGHKTTSTVFSFLVYELILNTDIQDKVREEIDELVERCGDNVTYNDIIRLKYMDMVVSECLRKWPPIPFSTRLCVKDYDLGPVREGSSDSFVVKKGEHVWIPVHSIHMDPNLWPNPEKFDPERFSKENAKNIQPQSFLPFGSGPRSCVGSRFALLNLKVIIFHMFHKFKFEVCPKTIIPIKLYTKTLFLDCIEGYWAKMTMRSEVK